MDKFANLMPGVAPLITSIVSYATSEGAILLVLRMYIDDCYKIADEMLKAHFQG
jgi:hypothetical protein